MQWFKSIIGQKKDTLSLLYHQQKLFFYLTVPMMFQNRIYLSSMALLCNYNTEGEMLSMLFYFFFFKQAIVLVSKTSECAQTPR